MSGRCGVDALGQNSKNRLKKVSVWGENNRKGSTAETSVLTRVKRPKSVGIPSVQRIPQYPRGTDIARAEL
jgi:hypothetical protein